ncbi:tyrosine-type recombinase/integrase [Streptacidiphilus fuscans]|uniref:tyrosine-type recombinase/integrase n=1 Tax=Streptacidiphilus fuscans TaxID=2789292 RepID=UPI001F3F01DC|nr:site-specific integrase [Streptacidiphilus fuscans]
MEIYREKRELAAKNPGKAERIRRYGSMRFKDYVTEWKAGQRDLSPGSLRSLDSMLNNHLYPALASRRMNAFDFKVVEGFLQTTGRGGVGLAAQASAFNWLKSILLDAHRLGLYDEHPIQGVKPPRYRPGRAVIPSPLQLRGIRDAGDETFRLLVDLMTGCGMRNGEAAAVNINNIVADDVYRITEQVHHTTKRYAALKARKVGDYRDVPLPVMVREGIERFAEQHGTTDSGYLLLHPKYPSRPLPPHWLPYHWQKIKKAGLAPIPGAWWSTASGTSSRRTA